MRLVEFRQRSDSHQAVPLAPEHREHRENEDKDSKQEPRRAHWPHMPALILAFFATFIIVELTMAVLASRSWTGFVVKKLTN
ncbi:hypothetical protein X765_30685 [Mesorhizobium sp. LSHC440B00]|nr:hypothetical protein X765_30685 [Mesorhizobium sp. LSHC440B00]